MQSKLYVLLSIIKFANCFFYPLIFPEKVYNYTPPESEVAFHLYHRSNFGVSDQILIGDGESLARSRFDSYLETKILVHGWTHSKDTPWMIELREALGNVGLWNVIVVDWSLLSRYIYVEARLHGNVVGKQLKEFLIFLKTNTKINMSSVHLIGHSMGAQISGNAGFNLHKTIDEKVGRITGLDPAGPLYEWPHIESMDEVLDPTDAIFVDVIHTNARHLGMMTPAGHIDFYPDGGKRLNNCETWSCSHLRVCDLFIASVKNPGLFRSFRYKDWNDFRRGKTDFLQSYPMGISVSPDMPDGIYFVTNVRDFRFYVESKTSVMDSFI